MTFTYSGKRETYAQLGALKKHDDESIRRSASESAWSPFQQNAAQLDVIFDELVKCRKGIATAEGHNTYADVAYRRLGRSDYGIEEVRALRDEIRAEIVPLVQAMHNGEVMPWNEFYVTDSTRLPLYTPVETLLRDLQTGMEQMHSEIGEFFERFISGGYLDVEDRVGKAPGAFCEFLPHHKMPFVFANATGSCTNLTSIAHEAGHAYQNYTCRDRVPLDFVVPTNEVGEISSIAMELLLWPSYDATFGEAAEDFRRSHLRTLTALLPYIAAVDHFQELIYERTDVSPLERRKVWLELQKIYMPWRTHGGIAALREGREWQAQRHIYRFPFYYIDYGIAICCALQIWRESRTDYRRAVERYMRLCSIGGSLPFRKLVHSAGLLSPFQRGTLTEIAKEAAEFCAPATIPPARSGRGSGRC